MIQIRIANAEEISTIVDFQLKMALETENLLLSEKILQEGVSEVFKNHEKGKYYVALCENKIVASLLTTFEWSDWRNSTIIWLQSVYVIPEFRKKGIFKQMYEHIKKIVESSSNYCGIKLYVDKTNIKAQKVYDSVGMNGEHYITYEWMK